MRKGSISTGLRNADLRRSAAAYSASTLAEWGLWVAVLVYAYQHGGPRAAGIASLALLAPSAVAAVVGGPLADGRRPERVVLIVHLAQSLTLAGAAVCAWVQAPVGAVIACSAGAIAATALVRPCYAVVVPSVVRSVGELTAANVLIGYADNIGVLAGPLMASAAIAADGPRLVFVIAAALTLLAAGSVLPLLRRRPAATEDDEQPRGHHPLAALRASMRALGTRKGTRAVLAVIVAEYMVIGALDLLTVIFAIETLGLSASTAGLLSASFGAGCLLGGLGATALVGRGRLVPWLGGGLAAASVSLAAIGAGARHVAVAVALLVLAGAGRALANLTSRMLLQRSAPADALASVFAVVEVLVALGLALGSITAQVLIAASGPRAALIGAGAVIALTLAITGPSLRHADRAANVPVVVIQLLRQLPTFAVLQGTALEAVARAAVETHVPKGTEVIRQGDIGDRFYAVADGEVRVDMNGAFMRTIHRGDGFGDIALLADVPRIATVTATTDCTLYAIDRDPFLLAVTGNDSSHRAAWRTIGRLDTGSALDGRLSGS